MKLLFSILFKGTTFKILSNSKYFSVVISPKYFYALSLHFKLSSLMFSTQLLDVFSYSTSQSKISNSSVCYYFFNYWFNSKIFVFLPLKNSQSMNSITELFLNANWLEREASELSGVFYLLKKDTRNLMLPYGDSSFPFKKSFPSIGYRELFYNNLSNTIISTSVSIQY